MPATLAPNDRPASFALFAAVLASLFVLSTPVEAANAQKLARTPAVRAVAVLNVAHRQSNDDFNRDVRIHNQTGWTMTYLYASGGGGWTDDLLGSAVLSPGDSMVVTVDDGSGACRYALRAEFDNGETLQRNGLNACQVADYYFTR